MFYISHGHEFSKEQNLHLKLTDLHLSREKQKEIWTFTFFRIKFIPGLMKIKKK